MSASVHIGTASGLLLVVIARKRAKLRGYLLPGVLGEA